MMKIEDRHKNIVLTCIDFYKNQGRSDISARTLVQGAKITEQDISIALSSLISEGLVQEPDGFLTPKTQLYLSNEGEQLVHKLREEAKGKVRAFTPYSCVQYQIGLIQDDKKELEKKKKMDYSEALKTHMWKNTGSYASGAGQVLRTKWYPMGSFCRKCGITTSQFKVNPKKCSKA